MVCNIFITCTQPSKACWALICYIYIYIFFLQQRCRTLYCPFGQAPLHGNCKRLFTSTTGVSLYFLFQLDILWDQTTLGEGRFEDGEFEMYLPSVYKEVYDRLRFDRCSYCTLTLCTFKAKTNANVKATPISTSELPVSGAGPSKPNGTSQEWGNTQTLQGVLFSAEMISNKDCQFDFIVEKAFAGLDKGVKISLHNHLNITFSANLRHVSQAVELKKLSSDCFGNPLGKIGILGCGTPFIITKKPCPEFHLEYSEVLSLPHGIKTTMLSHFFDTQKELNGTTVVKVCVEDYHRIMDQWNGSGSFSTQIVKLSLIVSLLYM